MPPRRVPVNRTNGILLVVGVGIVTLLGLAIHGPVGGILLLLVAAVLVMFTQGAWGHVRREGRPLRILVIAAIVVLAVLKLIGQL